MSVLKAIKENKVYTVNTPEEAKAYRAKGFDIYEDGKLKERGIGKTVSNEEYEAVKKENSKLKAENTKLKKENTELKSSESKSEK